MGEGKGKVVPSNVRDALTPLQTRAATCHIIVGLYVYSCLSSYGDCLDIVLSAVECARWAHVQ